MKLAGHGLTFIDINALKKSDINQISISDINQSIYVRTALVFTEAELSYGMSIVAVGQKLAEL